MIIAIALIIVVLILGIIEQIKHNKNLDRLETRIVVNGTRGKSTVTRLITGMLKYSGKMVVGKTTGTSARIIYWNSPDEEEIVRGRLGPNIMEQKSVVKKAIKLGADTFVTECMAVNPDYQVVFQDKLIKANIGVIVNVREDHLDLCGPTLDFIAESFTATIPQNGYLIVTNSKYNDFYTQEAKKRNSQIIITYESDVPEGFLEKFNYILFPENVCIVFGVAQALGIDKETALEGMLTANADPGALMIYPLDADKTSFFVNGFAANDPHSTLLIWNYIESIGYPTSNPIVVVNCRPDRVERTIQIVEDVLPKMQIDILVAMGQVVRPITDAVEKKNVVANKYLNLENMEADKVFENLKDHLEGRVVYGIGNIHGGGEELVELLIKQSLSNESAAVGTNHSISTKEHDTNFNLKE